MAKMSAGASEVPGQVAADCSACWGVVLGHQSPPAHAASFSPIQHPPPLDALSILLSFDSLSVLPHCGLLPGKPSLEVLLCSKMAVWAGEGWVSRTVLTLNCDLPHT